MGKRSLELKAIDMAYPTLVQDQPIPAKAISTTHVHVGIPLIPSFFIFKLPQLHQPALLLSADLGNTSLLVS